MSASDAWNFFDKAYCISLAEREDRRSQAKAQFARVGLLKKVTFMVVDKHSHNPEQGIFESHCRCLNRALQEGGRRILIFEDDVVFHSFNPAALKKACQALDKTPEWNAFFLGCLTDNSVKTSEKHLVKIGYRCLSHAYAVHAPFAEQIIQKKWAGVPYDGLLRNEASHFFALYPMCAFQGFLGTDNSNLARDRMRNICGGLSFIQKANEFYQNNKITVVISHLLALVLLGALLFRL